MYKQWHKKTGIVSNLLKQTIGYGKKLQFQMVNFLSLKWSFHPNKFWDIFIN